MQEQSDRTGIYIHYTHYVENQPAGYVPVHQLRTDRLASSTVGDHDAKLKTLTQTPPISFLLSSLIGQDVCEAATARQMQGRHI